ncbi:aminotransferase class I/II-fold pyridoxal phosphate-dependent enzyme [Rhodococcus spelaei]|uniref:Aminotransferase class I/II-fold pyridoxal phosphate-dependent enzyme n=1 Tax=Rhodococcus spelaei TaxID=2546320 RepID=A0A541BQS7_9NOCA|nr:aminotransferase class I/II-fold pyridoxal phosphate-dependent enzyme [Rhodococcus spelaei]TQF74666.1 aminotransferase class I/II-fold pyridoxal phosphate-dependent enzyme [Rhodococcus spelaei]
MSVLALDTPRFELALSENPFRPLRSVRRALERAAAEANRYPEFLPRRLPALIAARLGLDPAQVVVGAGATGVALQVLQAVARPGQRIVFASPTFDGYPILASMVGVEQAAVPLGPDGQQDLGAMASAVDDRTALAVVCRPHNPTGTVVEADALLDFLAAVPDRVVVVLDEAYVEFLAPELTVDALELVRRFPNLLVLRTFSKAYGLAALRIGFGFGSPGLIERVHRLQLPFGMGGLAEPAVRASFEAQSELAERVRAINTERDRMRGGLSALGIETPRSHANFLYLPASDRPVAALLAGAGVAAKTYPSGAVRIAVGDPIAGRAVLHALAPTRR